MSDSASSRPFPSPQSVRKTISETSRISRPSEEPSEISASRSTALRPRIPEEPTISDAPPSFDALPSFDARPSLSASPARPSVAPESLRKPYASLTPPKRSVSPTPPPTPSAPTWEDASSLSRPNSRPSHGVCKKHKIARRSDGQCMMCRKEEVQALNGRGWKTILVLVMLAVAGSAIAAALV